MQLVIIYKLCHFAVVVVVAVLSSDLYCFSCFGFTGEVLDSWKGDPTKSVKKCESRDTGFLVVRKCTTNSTKLPVCIKFKAKYQVPQMIGDRLEERFVEAEGVHCGTRRQCSLKECPNYWPNDIKNIKDCEIECCSQDEFPDCKFPAPNKDEIDNYNRRKVEESGKPLSFGEVGARTGDAARIAWPVWLHAVSFLIFAWSIL